MQPNKRKKERKKKILCTGSKLEAGIAFNCHVVLASFNLEYFLNLHLSFMMLTFLKNTGPSLFWEECSSFCVYLLFLEIRLMKCTGESQWSTCQCRKFRFGPRLRKIPWRRKWQPTPVFLPREFHGQRSLAGYSPLMGYSSIGSQSWTRLNTNAHSLGWNTA